MTIGATSHHGTAHQVAPQRPATPPASPPQALASKDGDSDTDGGGTTPTRGQALNARA